MVFGIYLDVRAVSCYFGDLFNLRKVVGVRNLPATLTAGTFLIKLAFR